MVKIGFIVEGGTEKVLVESPQFVAWLNEWQLELVKPIIDAKGGGNLLPRNIEPLVALLRAKGAEHIVILTDLENAADVDSVKERITNQYSELIFVAVKAIEVWFLADTEAMKKWLNVDDFIEIAPEETVEMPWERLRDIANELNLRGPGSSKVSFAKRMVKHYGFLVTNAADHSNCPSATEFKNGLMALSNS